MNINRHLSRSLALQILFELDINSNLSLNQEGLEIIMNRYINDFVGINNNSQEISQIKTDNYTINLIKTVQEKLYLLDDIILKAAPEWPLERINIIDRNILRLGLVELLFGNNSNVPPKVAIDEAVELAKNFGGEISYKFVNGVLGTIYKEMGEPQKYEHSKDINQKKTKDLEIQNLVGALVYSKVDGKIFFVFVKDIFKYWTLPKGKLLENEDFRVGAIRKIKEETGLSVVIKDILKENSYIANNINLDNTGSRKIKKVVTYFLAESLYKNLILEKENAGILEAKWFLLDEIYNLKMYSDIKKIIKIGLEKINI